MSDFQDPIDLIPKYIAEWDQGHKGVMAQKDSSDENFVTYSIKKFLYKFISKVSETTLLVNTTGAGLYDREIINLLKNEVSLKKKRIY